MEKIYKVHLKKSLFLLPMNDEKLYESVSEKFNVKSIDTFHKIAGVTQVTDPKENDIELIQIEKPYTINIFLLNQLFLLIEKKGLEIVKVITKNDDVLENLEHLLSSNLKGLSYSEIKNTVNDYLGLSDEKKPTDNDEKKDDVKESLSESIEKENDTDIFSNVKFDLNWLKNAHQKIINKEK